MASTTLRTQVLSVISESLGINPSLQLHHTQQQLIDDLGADSLEVALISMNLEEAFGVEIDDCDLFKKKDATIEDVIQLVSNKIGMEVPA